MTTLNSLYEQDYIKRRLNLMLAAFDSLDKIKANFRDNILTLAETEAGVFVQLIQAIQALDDARKP